MPTSRMHGVFPYKRQLKIRDPVGCFCWTLAMISRLHSTDNAWTCRRETRGHILHSRSHTSMKLPHMPPIEMNHVGLSQNSFINPWIGVEYPSWAQHFSRCRNLMLSFSEIIVNGLDMAPLFRISSPYRREVYGTQELSTGAWAYFWLQWDRVLSIGCDSKNLYP